MDDQKQLREHIAELLEGRSAHIDVEAALNDFPVEKMNDRPGNSPHSAWDLLEHIRIAQWDIIEFSRDPKHVSPAWPEGYWPNEAGTAAAWKVSVNAVLDGLETIRKIAADPSTDLFATIPHGNGQTLLREILLVADHNAYHLGQIVLLQKTL